jgi:(4S)-4-hydroxy-5-phosphonooxypentane-2,3-dione isomerase
MSGFVVIVEFEVKPGSRPAFRQLMDANARDSAKKEPGCRRFDVVEPAGKDNIILLYEIYDDKPAFDAHVRSDHYVKFDAASAGLVAKKTVTTGNLVCEGSA